MNELYTSGKYLEVTQTWHAEDSPWKAEQILRIMKKNSLRVESIMEIGCGSGAILHELSKNNNFKEVLFSGYDISPQAIEMANKIENEKIKFYQEDVLSKENIYSDLLLIIDVFEHVPDYMGFIEGCKKRAEYKIYHVPLDIHVSSVFRNSFIKNRYTIGHIHYFTAESAIATLRDSGHEIIDYFYTNPTFGLFEEHPTFKKAVANVPRWLISQFSVSFAARLLGGYSLMVLAK